jgi:hypothetical protein
MRSLSRLKHLFFVVFITSNALCQQNVIKYPLVQVIDNDTLITFKVDQAKKLAVFNEERKKLITVNGILEKQSILKDSVIQQQKEVITTYINVEKAQQVIIDEKNKQLELTNSENKLLHKEIKKQKRYKWTAVISGITVNIFTIWITQKL